MSTTTVDDELEQIRRRIDRLSACARTDTPRVWRHLEPLRQAEGAVLAALRQRPGGTAEEELERLKMRLEIAEHSVEADVADDWATFAAAVEAELRSWDVYLEQLQTGAAVRAQKARERAEAAISDLRSRRIEAGERLARVSRPAGAVSEVARKRITAARNELDKRAAALTTTFD